tara:strand:- start:115 stop:1059 length:945 start_codon:yes stop_codon:yes gene_type:complete
MNILTTNTGRRSYFVKYLINEKKKNSHIFVADNNIYNASMNISNSTKIKLPLVSDGEKKYLNSLMLYVKKKKINLIIPCTNYDLKILSKAKKKFNKINCNILVSSYDLICKLLDKSKTSEFCLLNKIKTPKIYYAFDQIKNKKRFFIKKKKIGFSSKNIKKIFKIRKKDFEKNYIIQEYVSGKEIHFDILNDLNGKFIDCCAKKKLLMHDGETYQAEILKNNKYYKLGKMISEKLRHVGNLDCDAIETNKGEVFFIDFNPRFGGGYPFTHSSGKNFISLIFNNFKKKNVKKEYKQKKQIFTKGLEILEVKNEKK